MHTHRTLAALFVAVLGFLAGSGTGLAASTGDLSGQVFADTDSDGTLGDADVPMAGFELAISGPNQGCAPACANATSDDTGAFQVVDLPPGDYTIRLHESGSLCSRPTFGHQLAWRVHPGLLHA